MYPASSTASRTASTGSGAALVTVTRESPPAFRSTSTALTPSSRDDLLGDRGDAVRAGHAGDRIGGWWCSSGSSKNAINEIGGVV